MARSVDFLSGADLVLYKSAHNLEYEDWDWFEGDIVQELKAIAPSLEDCDKWEDETHIILANELVEVGIAEYNGLVSVSIRANEYDYYEERNISGIAKRWIEKLRFKFESLGDLSLTGRFSNGEAMFVSKGGDTFSSKEGYCDWA